MATNEWTTIPKKSKTVTPKNYDEIPVSFAKIKHERQQNIKASMRPQLVSKTTVQHKNKAMQATNILNNIDEGDFKQPTISSSLSKQIMKARQDKGLSQKDLATLCNLNFAIIRDYESGVGIPKGNEINKMSSVLGVTLTNK
jgi:ribosome-binding protein aMBF1 (putative translation factor)